jgi:hypothetical protein
MLPDINVTGSGQTFLVDDIKIGGTSGTPTTLATFEAPTFYGFDGAEGSSIAGLPAGVPADGAVNHNNVARILRSGGQVWAGAKQTVGTIPLSASSNTVSMRVYAPVVGAFKIKLEGSGVVTAEVSANETLVVGWQTLTFTIPSGDLGLAVNAVTMLPDINVTGSGQTFLVDDIKIGSAASAPVATAVAFSSGYTDLISKGSPPNVYYEGSTAEGGLWGYYSDGFAVGTNTFTGGNASYRYIGTESTAAPTLGANGTYMGVYNKYKTGGLTLAGATFVNVELAADADFIASGKNTLTVEVIGSELFSNGSVSDCKIVASGTVKPTTETLTSYKIPLTTLGQGCNQSTITTAAQVLTHPIGNVSVTAAWPNINTTTANGVTTKFKTAFTLGKITFSN